MANGVLMASDTERVIVVHSFHTHSDALNVRCVGVTIAAASYGDDILHDLDVCVPLAELFVTRCEEAAMS